MTSATLPSDRPSPVSQALSLLRARPRESAGAGLLALAACLSVAAFANDSRALPAQPQASVEAATPSVQDLNPFAVRQIAPTDAQKLNAAVPLASGPNPAATPFVLKADAKIYNRALECLTQAVYYEAAREPEEGQRGVAQVVLNRMRHPAYPASVCAVVYQGAERPTGCQFSFTCDGSLARAPMRDYWDRARRVADEALKGYVAASVGNATHYHADYVAPYWAPTLTKNAVIGAHIFYRWKGGWGQPAAFTQSWAKRESDPAFLRSAALAAEARYAAMTPDTAVATTLAEARQNLPPELAKLVAPEIAAGGGKRVALRLEARKRVEEATRDAKPAEVGSSSLNWGLTGAPVGEAEQAPLGRKPADPATASAAANAAPIGAQ
ncbi:cell wall hydrolase [Sphingomonas kaistensis]|uniref:Cell wall hydrolase n=1 Tax=Sphingomonas kaistensis TaxID=298708 RepID=A0ABZ2G3I3_9SPHN